ncbi:MAG: hypothetical protein ACM3UY_06535 [Methanocella sp.]|jgi:hypothetical protein
MDEDYAYYETFIVKTLSNGEVDWSQTYGGSNSLRAYSAVETSDGGYAITGYTRSSLSYTSYVCLIKTSADGTLSWIKTYEIGEIARGYSVIQTSDGGYAITGYSDYNAVLLKTDVNGTLLWSKTFSLNDYDSDGYSVRQTSDGGYAIAGYTESMLDYSYDFLLVKVSNNGTLQWTKTWDGGESERARAPVASQDGSFVLAGYNRNQIILYKATVTLEVGLANIATTNNTITVYRGIDDSYWQYVRIQIWKAD